MSLFVSSFGSANFAVSFFFFLLSKLHHHCLSVFLAQGETKPQIWILEIGVQMKGLFLIKTQRLARGENSMCLSH